jgi:xanthine dehydrogenase accessory factor
MIDGVLSEAAALRARREPHVLATVVWSQRPVSGKPGAKALVLADGRVKGWVGGSCSEPLVVREAMQALEDGRPRLLHLGPGGEEQGSREGVVVKSITCASEGAVEVFLEPALAPPLVVAVGRAPLVRVFVSMARELGFDTAIVERDPVPPAELAEPHTEVQALFELDKLGVGPDSFVVVATMGRYDEDAIEAALATDAAYIGLVASRRRGEAVLSTLRTAGVPEEHLARVRFPAGLDLGAIAHEEIAVAILAELVQERASEGTTRHRAPELEHAVDPVCGMTVTVGSTADSAQHGDAVSYFCSSGCRRRFEADPEQFA